ncbi:MFS transporter [Pseudonocardia sp.]|uniref:MFS transporter n=1 Tax=Pseudonocardia sp. TaxID=60912 RepID=UPI002624C037|nr:MFS transporter [Pseudonocardia sp.]
MADVQLGKVSTQVPARMDRLPWSRWHWRIVVGLGTVWILDGLEVTMVGAVAAQLTEPDSGIQLSAGQIGLAGAIYIVGACTGALFFGQLTDRFGRKKLFLLTLVVYIVAVVATAFAFAPWYFYLARFVTGLGIGGEYAAINSAIDEFMPARVRGQVDLAIAGSYWLGSAGGAAMAVLLLNTLPPDLGWRAAFGFGALLGLVILFVRRHVPESPRWLFIHGRAEEAERIIDRIEREVVDETGQELEEPGPGITVRQRRTIPIRTIASTAFTLYPRRTVLGLALFVGQAFIYNGITFSLGNIMSTFFGVAAAITPVFIIIYALGNFAGPLTLGRLFDTVGRIPMIAGCYLGSAILTLPLAYFFANGSLNRWTFIALVVAIFFLASSGASAAYLTVSEVFPLETRALAIAFFYALGTALGGITGPLIFGRLIDTENPGWVAVGFLIGAGVMALGGVAELVLGVRTEKANLENIAQPLTAADAEREDSDEEDAEPGDDRATGPRRDAEQRSEEAQRQHAAAAEHRAAALAAGSGTGQVSERGRVEESLAEMAGLRAQELEEQAAAFEALADARDRSGHERDAARQRAQAAEQRARALGEQVSALAAERQGDESMHEALAAAAMERARAREQRALAEQALADGGIDAAGDGEDDGEGAVVARARAAQHEAWAVVHDERARVHEVRGEQGAEPDPATEERLGELERQAVAAEELVRVAEHRADAQSRRAHREASEEMDEQQRARERHDAEIAQRIRARADRRSQRDRAGLRRYRPGPSPTLGGGRLGGLTLTRRDDERDLDREVEVLARALQEHGEASRAELVRLIGARYWGPGRFGSALAEAVDEGRIRRLSRTTYGPVDDPGHDEAR